MGGYYVLPAHDRIRVEGRPVGGDVRDRGGLLSLLRHRPMVLRCEPARRAATRGDRLEIHDRVPGQPARTMARVGDRRRWPARSTDSVARVYVLSAAAAGGGAAELSGSCDRPDGQR